MDCEYLINLLSEYLDDELDFDLEQELEEHLGECPFCNPIYQSMIITIKSFTCSQEITMSRGTHQRLRRRLIVYSRTIKYRRLR